jgi:hypothetical protein
VGYLIQRIWSVNGLQALRGFNEPPAKLAAVLDLMRLVPPELVLPSMDELMGLGDPPASAGASPTMEDIGQIVRAIDHQMRDTQEMQQSPEEWFARKLLEAGVPENLRQHTVGQHNEAEFNEMVRRYEFVRTCRQSLRDIIRGTQTKQRESLWLSLSFPSNVMIDKNGIIRVGLDEFSRAIDGVDARRLRECQICGYIFWARRITQYACTTNCANALRVRRWRERYATTYKFTRMGISNPKKGKTEIRKKNG